MATQLLQDKDRIFTNLFGHHSPDLEGAKQRGCWNGTTEILQQGRPPALPRRQCRRIRAGHLQGPRDHAA